MGNSSKIDTWACSVSFWQNGRTFNLNISNTVSLLSMDYKVLYTSLTNWIVCSGIAIYNFAHCAFLVHHSQTMCIYIVYILYIVHNAAIVNVFYMLDTLLIWRIVDSVYHSTLLVGTFYLIKLIPWPWKHINWCVTCLCALNIRKICKNRHLNSKMADKKSKMAATVIQKCAQIFISFN